MERVDEQEAQDVSAMAGGEDAAIDAPYTGRCKNPWTLFSSPGKCFREHVGSHTSRKWGWCVIRPAKSWSIRVTVSGDCTVLKSIHSELLQLTREWFISSFEQNCWELLALWVCFVAFAEDMDLIFLTVNIVSFPWSSKRGIARAKNEGCSEQHNNHCKEN
jgi:hypothetical protein